MGRIHYKIRAAWTPGGAAPILTLGTAGARAHASRWPTRCDTMRAGLPQAWRLRESGLADLSWPAAR